MLSKRYESTEVDRRILWVYYTIPLGYLLLPSRDMAERSLKCHLIDLKYVWSLISAVVFSHICPEMGTWGCNKLLNVLFRGNANNHAMGLNLRLNDQIL